VPLQEEPVVSCELPISEAARYKEWVCARWLVAIVGSNSVMGQRCVSLVSVECVVRYCLYEGSITLRGESYRKYGGLLVILNPEELEGICPIGLLSYEKFVDYLTHKHHSLATQKLQRTVSK